MVTAATTKENAVKKKSIALDAIKYWWIFGIIAVLGTLIYLYTQYHDNEEKAAKRAAETYKKEEEQLEKVRKSYEDLKTSINSYEDALKNLDKVVKGTNEWNEAVITVNSSVLNLLSKYP